MFCYIHKKKKIYNFFVYLFTATHSKVLVFLQPFILHPFNVSKLSNTFVIIIFSTVFFTVSLFPYKI